MRVLAADDELGMRDLYRFLLESLGWQVVTAADGAEAVELAARSAFDVVLLDVHMPRLTGTEALPIIRNTCPQAAIVIVTSGSDPLASSGPALCAAGAAGLLLKPFTLDELLALLPGGGERLS